MNTWYVRFIVIIFAHRPAPAELGRGTLLIAGGALRMRPCRMPLLGCFQSQHQHVEDDPHVDSENQKSKPIWPSHQVCYLEWDVDGSRGDRHPLRPRACIPQAVGLD